MAKVLFIDTSSNKEIRVGVRVDGKDYLLKRKISRQKAQITLPMVDRLLRQHGLSLKDLSAIEVNVCFGSFTGIRVGMAIANTFSYTLKIPVKTRQSK